MLKTMKKVNNTINFYKYLKYIGRKNLNSENIKLKNNFELKKKIVKEIKQHGYYVIKNFLDQKECKSIIKKIDSFVKNYPKLIWTDKIKSDTRIFGAEYIDPKIENFCKNKFINDIGSLLLKKKLSSLMIMANKVVPKDRNLGSGQGWHKDSYAKQFKSILYLSDVKTGNGPFQLIEKTKDPMFDFQLFYKYEKSLKNTRFSEKEVKSISKNKKKIINVYGKKGTLILVDTSLIHRGMPIKKGKRYALTNYMYPKNSLKNFDKHFLPRIKRRI